MSAYAHLLAPGHLGSLELANRIVMPPMVTRLAHSDGRVSSAEVAFFVARARGGAGLLMTGGMLTSVATESPRPSTLRVDDDRYVAGLTRLASAVHEAGSRISAQLTPGAGRAGAAAPGRSVPVSASPNPWVRDPALLCRALSPDEIHAIVASFGDAARRVAEAGFDALDIQGNGGHLLDQFLTSNWNHRTDGYGGSLERRTRFAVELVAAARAAAPGLPISFRLTAVHHGPGGRDLEESLEIARVLQAAGVDLMVVDEGSPEAADRLYPPYYLGDGPSLASAAAVRRVLGIPVMATGNVTAELAEKSMADGEIDFAGMGRQLLAEPDLPRLLAGDRPGRIRPCVRCNGCVAAVKAGSSIGCAVNPVAGHEATLTVKRASRLKHVVVVGGGPAGLEAARVAALRGHTVDLYERSGHLGGILWPAATPLFKGELRSSIEWWRSQLVRLGVTIHLNWEISAGSPALASAHEVVIATGALPVHPVNLSGWGRRGVLDALDVHRGATVGHRVVIAGGGLSGADLALELALSGHEVTLVEQESAIARDMVEVNRVALERRLAETGVTVLTEHSVRAVGEDGAITHGPRGTVHLAADSVVLALGMRANATLTGIRALEDPRVHLVGDCVEPGKIGDAVHSAFAVASAL